MRAGAAWRWAKAGGMGASVIVSIIKIKKILKILGQSKMVFFLSGL